MLISPYILTCTRSDPNTKRTIPFRAIKYTFNYSSDIADKSLLTDFITKGETLALKVNPGAANDGRNKRAAAKIRQNCIAGLLAEYLWKDFLNRKKVTVEETEMEEASTQIDLRVIANGKKIEVRSSFPRNGIDFAICHSTKEFDILGFYSNDYKPGEIQKDYYLRTLFHLAVERYWEKDSTTRIPIIEKLEEKMKRDGFEVFLTGGADWNMMIDDAFSQEKHLIPEDEISQTRLQTKSSYRVVPFSKALDTYDIFEQINSEQ
ncbi:MAG: hypothetical protein ACI85O_002729 [Saprospiraceae bacterium]|jgi:hypothetical protein